MSLGRRATAEALLLPALAGCSRRRPPAVPFAGIRPADVPLFVAAQLAGAFCATPRWQVPE